MTEGEAQAALAEIALELVGIEDRLQRIHDRLPRSRRRDAMWEHRIPRDVATEIYGTIECVLADHLREVIGYIEGAARVTADELRERHREERELARRFLGGL